MDKETSPGYHIKGAADERNPTLASICKQLDNFGIKYKVAFNYTLEFGDNGYITFEQEQNREWIKENIHLVYVTPNLEDYPYKIVAQTKNLLECDNWLAETYGPLETSWTAGFSDDYNTYFFKNEDEALAFKLKFG